MTILRKGMICCCLLGSWVVLVHWEAVQPTKLYGIMHLLLLVKQIITIDREHLHL